MITAARLLKDLQRLLGELEADLRERVGEVAEIDAILRAQYRAAKDAGRAGEAYEVWRDGFFTQAAAAWILGGVFVRFLEDNALIDPPRLAGPGERGRRALDEQELYFRHADRRTHSDRDYLLHVFGEVRALPAATELFDPRHNPLWAVGPTGDGATRLLRFWQRVDPDTGALAHDFTDPDWNTRFLGDLYQDLSEGVRKKYALLQTPEFVEAFILDRTLMPAIEEFGFQVVRLLDPTCGSGHFLLGAFERLFDRWVRHEPGTNPRVLAQRALDQVCGVDLNPYAVAIARFRLLIAALKASEVRSLSPDQAPAFHVKVAAGDSLLHGHRFLTAAASLAAGGGLSEELDIGSGAEQLAGVAGIGHAFFAEDLDALNRILGQQYHAVVGNPPYITVKDAALNALYRTRYATCHMKYSLGVPFTERFFELALPSPAGFVGMITTNSFMKREFGRKLIEEFLPRVDLTHVIDTSGAYIPGHGTPTVILFGRDRAPVGDAVRTVMGIKGEPSTPDDPAQGLVWTAIVGQVDVAGSESAYVSVADTPRATFARHPWSIGGGGAVDLKEVIEEGRERLEKVADSIGITSFTLEDEAFVRPRESFVRLRAEVDLLREMVVGDELRDWSHSTGEVALFPYGSEFTPVELQEFVGAYRSMWPYRTNLSNNKLFGQQTKVDAGMKWWEFGRLTSTKLRTPLSITFGEVATHNHFVFDRGGKVFKQTAPVIKLPAGAGEDDHLALLGLLNSSVGCFWLKQVAQCKGGGGINEGHRGEFWEFFFQFNGTKVGMFPLVDLPPTDLARALDQLARERAASLPAAVLDARIPTRTELDAARRRTDTLRRKMMVRQEELDWRCYRLYGLADDELTLEVTGGSPPEIDIGERAFEIVMARQMARGELETAWFERHGSTPITEIPAHWPEDYRRLVERRIVLIESDRNIGLIERPEYKRRWNTEPWEVQEQRALRDWLLDRLETERYWPTVVLVTTRRLADFAAQDADFMRVAELYRGHPDFDVHALVAELVEGEAVPFLPVLRYKESGLRNRTIWERTWELQRREDAIDAAVEAELRGSGPEPIKAEQKRRKHAEVGDIPVPPKYKSADFLNATFWRLRGALDVPKERFVSYAHCAKATDPSLVVAWAGWDHLQQSQALAGYYIAMKEQEGWTADRLTPLLAGLLELVPWVKQWHNDPDPAFGGTRMGDYFADFVAEEARELALTPDQIRAWVPPAGTGTRRGRKKKAAAE